MEPMWLWEFVSYANVDVLAASILWLEKWWCICIPNPTVGLIYLVSNHINLTGGKSTSLRRAIFSIFIYSLNIESRSSGDFWRSTEFSLPYGGFNLEMCWFVILWTLRTVWHSFGEDRFSYFFLAVSCCKFECYMGYSWSKIKVGSSDF